MVNLSTAKTLAFTLGPLFLPKAISYIRTLRAKQASSNTPIQPLPRSATYTLNILFVSAVLAFISTFPNFHPENVFKLTTSRLQTPNDVLFTRLAAARGASGLTPNDETLKPKLASLDSRLLYLTYGPNVVIHCPFCMSDEPYSYLLYALPVLLLPHLLHLFTLGLATATAVGGKGVDKWRVLATFLGMGAALVEVYMYAAYDYKANSRAFYQEEYVYYYERMRIVRGAMIAILDLTVAGLVYLSGTNRMFTTPPTSAERIEAALRVLEGARGKISALAILKNAIVRDEGMRRRNEGYWIREGQIMGEVMDEREVVEGVRNALTERVQVSQIENEAQRFADGLIPATVPLEIAGESS